MLRMMVAAFIGMLVSVVVDEKIISKPNLVIHSSQIGNKKDEWHQMAPLVLCFKDVC